MKATPILRRSADRGFLSILCVLVWIFLRPIPLDQPPDAGRPDRNVDGIRPARAGLRGLPIYFEPVNGGNIFAARHATLQARIAPTEFVTVPGTKNEKGSPVRARFLDAGPEASIEGLQPLPGKANYLIGNDPSSWRSNIPLFGGVRVRQLYRGIDVVYYANDRDLEYDLIVSPDADPAAISIEFDGVDHIELAANGDLLLHSQGQALVQQRPRMYQQTAAGRHPVNGSYTVEGERRIGFLVENWDRMQPLVIDPVLTYVVAFGGSGVEAGWGVAVDAQGNTYVTGSTSSTDLATSSPAQATPSGGRDVFVMKLDPRAATVLYATYIGGSGNDDAYDIGVDANGSAFVGGATNSPNFPTRNAFQAAMGGGTADAIAIKLDPAGSSLVFSTYIGGTTLDIGWGAASDAAGNGYLVGESSGGFPQVNGLSGLTLRFQDAFAAKFGPTGTIVYSTLLAGGGTDIGLRVAADSAGNAFVTGFTLSFTFPTTQNAYQPAFRGGAGDAFATKIGPLGPPLVFSTYLGSNSYDWGQSIAVDSAGSAHITGFTDSQNFPTVNALQGSNGGGGSDVFLVKLNPTATQVVYSTYFGGNTADVGNGVVVDATGNAYVVGGTSGGLTTPDSFQGPGGGADGFVMKVSPAGSLLYASYFGGSASDTLLDITAGADGSVYFAGSSSSPAFSTLRVLGSATRSGSDFIVGKIAAEPGTTFTLANRGGVSVRSPGAAALSLGYGRIIPSIGNSSPSGVAIFGYRQNNILVSEAGVPASPTVGSGRIYAEVGGAVNTGLAVANPNSQTVTLDFYFTDASGVNFGQDTTTIPPNGQIARFLNEAPFKGGASVSGTFTFTASAPVAVIALRGFTNERGEFLLTTLPVADPSAVSTDPVYAPHFADGGGWNTQIVLVNPGDTEIGGAVQFFEQGPAGGTAPPASVTVGSQSASSFPYTIPQRTSRRIVTSGGTGAVRVGSVQIRPSAGTRTPTALVVFTFKNAGFTASEAGVQALRPGSAFRMYAEASGDFAQGQPGSVQTGIAVSNPGPNPATVNFELTTLAGTTTGLTGSVPVPGLGQTAKFLNEIQGLSSLQLPFQGVLRISTTGLSGISVTGLRGRYNERGDFLITTTPPVNEAAAAATGELFFPHFADGSGYTTQFVLFSGIAGQSSSGLLRFLSQGGQSLNLNVR